MRGGKEEETGKDKWMRGLRNRDGERQKNKE